MSRNTEAVSPKHSDTVELTGRPCPICRKPGIMAYRPFCSKRCADVDLNRWLSGAYAIAATEEEDEDGEAPYSGRSRD